MKDHRCEQIAAVERPQVDGANEYPIYGHAIHAIVKTDDGWIMHNYEYADYISFCPFCGQKLD